jgi:hypothetical protein
VLVQSEELCGFLTVASPHEQPDAVGHSQPRLEASGVVAADHGVNLIRLEHGPSHFGFMSKTVGADYDQIVLMFGVRHKGLDSAHLRTVSPETQIGSASTPLSNVYILSIV